MPEGPEIRRAADRIGRVLVGNEVEKARLHLKRLARFDRRISGRTVLAVDTRGKAMLTRFDNGLTLYSHNQLYGRWYTTRRPRLPQTNRQLRVELHTACDSALLYSASDIDVLDEQQLARHPFLCRIGPDLLDPRLDREDVASRLTSTRFARRATGTLYLDQAFIAGLGNYLRSEILFASQIHPAKRPIDLDTSQVSRLARATLRLSRRSYRTGGLTVPPQLERSLKKAGQSFARRRFYVFGRQGRPCRECGSEIQQLQLAGRNIFICPRCQPV